MFKRLYSNCLLSNLCSFLFLSSLICFLLVQIPRCSKQDDVNDFFFFFKPQCTFKPKLCSSHFLYGNKPCQILALMLQYDCQLVVRQVDIDDIIQYLLVPLTEHMKLNVNLYNHFCLLKPFQIKSMKSPHDLTYLILPSVLHFFFF